MALGQPRDLVRTAARQSRGSHRVHRVFHRVSPRKQNLYPVLRASAGHGIPARNANSNFSVRLCEELGEHCENRLIAFATAAARQLRDDQLDPVLHRVAALVQVRSHAPVDPRTFGQDCRTTLRLLSTMIRNYSNVLQCSNISEPGASLPRVKQVVRCK
jgi:hypothetical protein